MCVCRTTDGSVPSSVCCQLKLFKCMKRRIPISLGAPILTGKDVHPPRLRTASSSNSVPIRDESARA